jgi:hypothetical protein
MQFKMNCRKWLFAIALLGASNSFAQTNFWNDASETSFTATAGARKIIPLQYRTFKIDSTVLKATLAKAPMEFTQASRNEPLVISLPTPNGGSARFAIVESPGMEKGLSELLPIIKTYSGQGIDDRTATIKLDWTYNGFHAQVLSPISGAYYIDPYALNNLTDYQVYFKTALTPRQALSEENMQDLTTTMRTNAGGFTRGSQLRTYRLAVACTGEYAVAVGGAGVTQAQAQSAIVTTVNRVNGVYEKELTVRLILVANNINVVYINSATDPFTGNNSAGTLITESQTTIDGVIGNANYDVGHTFSTGGGGLASLACVCITGLKARGITGSSQPTGDAYDIDYVAHEIGHQFGGRHTFNANTGECSGNGSTSTNVEPGSGTTIMAYAGICLAANNLQNNSDAQFHAISFGEIIGNVQFGSASNCGTVTNTDNNPPVVTPNNNYTIPRSTPFVLTGSASDADGDALTYSWEQINTGAPFGNWNSPSGNNAPIFRSFSPTTSPTRYFPRLSDVLNNTTTIGEIMPSYARSLNFRLTVRDNRNNGGGIASEDATITVDGTAGPFSMSSFSTATNLTANGSNTMNITWNVAGTTAAPVNCATVDILFSVDGGQTFPYTLASNTSNDGTETIVVPSLPTAIGRIMVKARNNVFFTANTANITITSACTAEGAVIAPAADVVGTTGSAMLNLGLSPQFGATTNVMGTLQVTDPATTLAVNNLSAPSCINFSNPTVYDTYTLLPAASGTYNFNLVGTLGTIVNINTGSYNSASPCTGFLRSSATYNGMQVGVSSTWSQFLTAGTTYALTVTGFNASTPALPAAYTVSYTSPYPNPGAGFSYGYVIVNNATGNIVAISSTPNLSDGTTFPAGTYTIYGFSYSNSIAGNIAAYVGGSFNTLNNDLLNNPASRCGNLSKNSVKVTINTPQPVKLINLAGRRVNNKVLVSWSTANEVNSSHFVVERSANGSQFIALGNVTAAGNSSTLSQYSFNDLLPLAQTGYYRIKMVDKDGSFAHSNVVLVKIDKANPLLVVYPNPVKNQLNAEFTVEKAAKVEFTITDITGSVILRSNKQAQKGYNQFSFSVQQLSAGTYLLQAVVEGKQMSTVKFMKD